MLHSLNVFCPHLFSVYICTYTRSLRVLQTKILAHLGAFFKSPDNDIRLLVSQALCLLAKTSAGKKGLLELAFVPYILVMCMDQVADVRFHAYECLKYFTDSKECLDKVVDSDGSSVFTVQSRDEIDVVIRTSALLLLDRCLRVARGLESAIKHNALSVCMTNAKHEVDHVRSQACQCLVTISTAPIVFFFPFCRRLSRC